MRERLNSCPLAISPISVLASVHEVGENRVRSEWDRGIRDVLEAYREEGLSFI